VGPTPWDIGRPQTAFVELAQACELHGRVLDMACGTGEHALMAARLGLEASGVDRSQRAIATAKAKAEQRGLAVRFVVWDALKLASFDG
jgi:2-polyprenyl-3-methyl-5-hydroxy-6-metoxy-1,4-benzoquinol methylase